MSNKIVTEEYHRDFAIDRGRGTEYVKWTAWETSCPNVRGYGKTEEEAKDDLRSRTPVSLGGK